ncbi:MAG: hypothetical protein ACXW0Z_21815 [Gemmatirosa sp.]
MRPRLFRFQIRNPVVAVALLIVVLALVAAVVAVGLTLLAGLAAVGAAGLLARRALGGRRSVDAAPPRLDRAQEVFPTAEVPPGHRLPPAPGADQERG